MENKLKENFINFNVAIENIQNILSKMNDFEKRQYIQNYFGIRNIAIMEWFIQKYIPVKY